MTCASSEDSDQPGNYVGFVVVGLNYFLQVLSCQFFNHWLTYLLSSHCIDDLLHENGSSKWERLGRRFINIFILVTVNFFHISLCVVRVYMGSPMVYSRPAVLTRVTTSPSPSLISGLQARSSSENNNKEKKKKRQYAKVVTVSSFK